jgi:hypothetical protein
MRKGKLSFNGNRTLVTFVLKMQWFRCSDIDESALMPVEARTLLAFVPLAVLRSLRLLTPDF